MCSVVSTSRAAFAVNGLLFLASAGGIAFADSVPALNFDHANPVSGLVSSRGDIWDNHPRTTRGYGFEILETVEVTQLGVYDDNGDGLLGDYEVGVWRADFQPFVGLVGTELLMSGTVAGGQSADLSGSWRVVDTPDIELTPGIYFIGVLPVFSEFPDGVDQYYWLHEGSRPLRLLAASNDSRFSLNTNAFAPYRSPPPIPYSRSQA